jgi:peptidyl-prolyl cis-trans isomerase D
MLQGFRTIINSIVGKVLFTILLLTFALLGVGYGFRDLVLGATGSNDAAKVGGDTISLSQLDSDYRRQLLNQQRRMGAAFNPTQAEKEGIAQTALDKDVDIALFADAARRDGFLVGDALLRDIIESERAFAGSDGRFDTAHFRALLENEGMTEGAFVATIREDIAKQMVLNPVAGSASAPTFLVDDIYRYRNEQRVAETVTIPNSAATAITPPTEAEIAAYYNAHPAAYTAPEYRSFTVLALSPDLFAGEINPTEADLRAAYDQHKADYVLPEKRKITQVVLGDQATADQVAKLARSGKSLADAAKAVTAGKTQPTALDFLARDDFPDALRDPVFGAEKGAVTGPVQSILGWHVLEVDDIQPGHQVPFDDVKTKLTTQLKHDGSADRLADQIDKIGDRLAGGAAMDAVAASVNAKAASFGPMNAAGEPESPAKPETLATPETLAKPGAEPTKPESTWIAEAFKLHAGETSQFMDSQDGGYYAVRLDSVTPAAPRPLADVRAEVTAAWTAEQKAAQIVKRADEIVAKVRAGTPMTQIAAEAGVTVVKTPPLLRDPLANKLATASPALVAALFGLGKVGDVTSVDAGDGRIVARLTEIKQADPKSAGADILPLRRELDAALQADDLAQYRAGLRRDIKVTINPDAVETVVGQQ